MEKEGAIKNEELIELRHKALEASKIHSPNLNEMQRVIIDRNTSIYVKKDVDPVEARNRFIRKMKERGFDVRYKNYDIGDE